MEQNLKSPEALVKEYAAELVREVRRWQTINLYGCKDPAWPDGSNMCLVRNHIIYCKRIIKETAGEHGLPLLDAYYIPTPPEVDINYMADKRSERYRRLDGRPDYKDRLTTDRVAYDDTQLRMEGV